MDLLSQRINTLSESETIEMAKKARELKEQGKNIINLSLGEPDFDTPDHIKEAAKKALDDGYTKYSPVSGYPELRKAISEKFKRDNNLDYSPEQIVVSTGAKQSLANIFLCLLNPGDEVIVCAPYWVTYREIIKLGEGIPVYVNGALENDFKASAQQIKAAITPKTKAVIYSSPSNPTGGVYTKEELKDIAEVVAQHPNIMIVSDEIYEYINFDGQHNSIAQFDFIKDQVVTVNGFAKGFAMTGWRVGYIGAPLWLAKACDKMQGQFTSGTNSMAQMACVAALNGDMKPTYAMRDAYHKRRDLVLELLQDMEGVKTYIPKGAFYIFPDVSAYFGKKTPEGEVIDTATALCMYLLRDALVSLVTGEAFGAPNCIRISFAASEDDLREAMSRIKNSLEKLS